MTGQCQLNTKYVDLNNCFFHSFPIFSKPRVAKVSQPLELQSFSCSATDFYDFCVLERANSRFLRRQT